MSFSHERKPLCFVFWFKCVPHKETADLVGHYLAVLCLILYCQRVCQVRHDVLTVVDEVAAPRVLYLLPFLSLLMACHIRCPKLLIRTAGRRTLLYLIFNAGAGAGSAQTAPGSHLGSHSSQATQWHNILEPSRIVKRFSPKME